MPYYNKKLGVYLPTTKAVILEKPKPVAIIPPPTPIIETVVELPYFHEVDELGIDWWICRLCNTGYNLESVQKRHQTMKHK